MNQKPSNPKDAFGIKKASLSCVSAPVLMEVGIGMQEGGAKYGRHNYRVIGVRGSVYYDATLRHLMSWWEGEDLDPDSGLSHITKAICSLVVLRDAMIQSKFNDDRPPRAVDGWLAPLNAKSEALFDKYPEPVKPYTQADNSWIDVEPTPETKFGFTIGDKVRILQWDEEGTVVGFDGLWIEVESKTQNKGGWTPTSLKKL